MRKFILAVSVIMATLPALAQEKNADKKPLTPYAGVMAGGCVDNPFQFLAGVQKTIKPHFTLSYDLHYWNTKYECYCDDMYSTGRFSSFTPSVKLSYNTGKKQGSGLVAGVGLGYMFAKDRGTEQAYTYEAETNTYSFGKEITKGNWDFNSIAPSFSLGVGFRLMKLPVVFQSNYYFANTPDGWMPAAGGVGFTIAFRKVK